MTAVHYAVTALDTDDLDASERQQAWRDEVRRNHGGLELLPRHRSGFEGHTVVQRAHDLQLVEFWSDAITYRRNPRDLRVDDDDTLRLLVPRHGRFLVEAADQRLVLDPSSAALVSMASPFTIAHDSGARAWVFSMPTDLLPRTVDPRRPQVLDVAAGIGAVVAVMLGGISSERDHLDAREFGDAAEALAHLVSRRAEPAPIATLQVAATEAVRRWSDDPDLTPAVLADRLGWSLRAVQLAAEDDGTTPSSMIRDARLSRALGRLRDPAWSHRGVADLAAASGFGSLSTFNATFRERFGRTPTEVRRDAAS